MPDDSTPLDFIHLFDDTIIDLITNRYVDPNRKIHFMVVWGCECKARLLILACSCMQVLGVWVRMHAFAHMYACMLVCMVKARAYVNACIHMHVHVHVQCTYIYVKIYVHIVHVCMNVCMNITCMHECVYMHIHIHIKVHTYVNYKQTTGRC